MPPIHHAPEEKIRYLTTLLSALCLQKGGELRIPRKFVRAVTEAKARQVIFERLEKDTLVLRFGSKDSAVYPVEPEPEWQTTAQPQPSVSVNGATNLEPMGKPQQPQVVKPWDERKIALAEKKLNAMKNVLRMKREREEFLRETSGKAFVENL